MLRDKTVSDAEVAEDYWRSLIEHIGFVREAGLQLGVAPSQLFIHDQSKFGEDEFAEYARQFKGKADNPDGFARAWLHHLHVNPHHWEHWMFPDGYIPKGGTIEAGVMEMPREFVLEMIADWVGASRGHTGSWNMADWLAKNIGKVRLHSKSAAYAREILDSLGYGDIANGPTAFAGMVGEQ